MRLRYSSHKVLLIFACYLLAGKLYAVEYIYDNECENCFYIDVEWLGSIAIPDGYRPHLSEILRGSYKFRKRTSGTIKLEGQIDIGISNVNVVVEGFINKKDEIARMDPLASINIEGAGRINEIDYINYLSVHPRLNNLTVHSCIIYSDIFYIYYDGIDEAICQNILEQIIDLNN